MIVEIRHKLQSARGDGFTKSQLEIFLGIFTMLVQMLILKILMIGQCRVRGGGRGSGRRKKVGQEVIRFHQ